VVALAVVAFCVKKGKTQRAPQKNERGATKAETSKNKNSIDRLFLYLLYLQAVFLFDFLEE